MSIRYVEAVLDGPDTLDGGRLKVLLALAEWADDTGLSWHSIAEIARRARLKERATQYVIQQLAEEGYLSVEQGHGRTHTSRYTVQIEALIKGAIGASIVAPFNKEEKVQNPTEKVQKTAIKGAIAIAPEPSLTVINRNVNSNARSRKTPIPQDFEVTDEMYFWASHKWPDLDIDEATETWRDAMLAKGYQNIDWKAAWRNGMKNAVKWAAERNGDEGTKFGRAVIRAGREIAGQLEQVHRSANGRTHEDYSEPNIFRLPEPKAHPRSG